MESANKIFTDEYRAKILAESRDLSYMSHGVIVGRGVLWMNVVKQAGIYKWRVIAINN